MAASVDTLITFRPGIGFPVQFLTRPKNTPVQWKCTHGVKFWGVRGRLNRTLDQYPLNKKG